LQAVILAGGMGTRLWPITKEVPKPMVPVAGVPYLEHQLKLLGRQHIADVLLLTGYLGEQIEDYFGDGHGLGLNIRYSKEKTPLGTGGALHQARRYLAPEFLLLYGDSLLPINYADVLETRKNANVEGVVVVSDNRLADTSVPSNISLDSLGFVVRYDKDQPGDPQLTHVEAGVLAFSRSAVGLVPDGSSSLERELYPQLIARRQLVSYPTQQRFYDIGTPERLRIIEAFLSHDHHTNPISN
jgi:NDP-sugar pyrophosphorylase family protein